MPRDCTGAENLRGSFQLSERSLGQESWNQTRTERYSEAPVDAGSQPHFAKARGRRPAETGYKVLAGEPWKAKPRGASLFAGALNAYRWAGNSRKGQTPEVAGRNPPRLKRAWVRAGETTRGCIHAGTCEYLSRGVKLRRVNPISAASLKHGRQGSKGANRQEGSQTLKTERSRRANLREGDLRDLKC